jgi:hypothetical protein
MMIKRDPLTLIADVIGTTVVALFAAGGVYAVLFFVGWCILSLYDTLVKWLGA